MKIEVRDYLRCERADLDVTRLAFLAGLNGTGKSSTLEAVQAALVRDPTVHSGVTKKGADVLVRTGAKKAQVRIIGAGGAVTVTWPACEVTEQGEEAPLATRMAAGLVDLRLLDTAGRAKALSRYVDGKVTLEDFQAAMADIGYTDKPTAELWERIEKGGGWDAAHKAATEMRANLKGQWQQLTGETFGSKKVGEWKPDNLHSNDAALTDRKELANRIAALRNDVEVKAREVEEAVGSKAVSVAELGRLKVEAALEVPVELEDAGAGIPEREARLEELRTERAQLQLVEEPVPQVAVCPHCGAECERDMTKQHLVLRVPVGRKVDGKAVDKARTRMAEIDGESRRLSSEVAEAQRQVARRDELQQRIDAAKLRLAEIDAAGGVNEDALIVAREEAAKASDRLKAAETWLQHLKIVWWYGVQEKAIELLAPSGLRFTKMGKALAPFNAALAALCAKAGWPVVRVDAEMALWWGEKTIEFSSASERWRAQLVLQVACARIDGSHMVIADAGDCLDHEQRLEPLTKLMFAAKLPILVAMAYNPVDVPDVAKGGIGQRYWMRDGVCEVLA